MNDWPDTNESLILRVKDPADGAAWTTFLSIYRPVVFRLARAKGLQHADADDLTQKVFVSIARSVERWQPGDGLPPFRAWVRQIAQNEILKSLTRRKPDQAAGSSSAQLELLSIEDPADATAELLHESRREVFRWAAEAIRPEFTATTWSMFWEATIESIPVAEVAVKWSRSVGAVYLARFRVMQRLKEKVAEVSDIWSASP